MRSRHNAGNLRLGQPPASTRDNTHPPMSSRKPPSWTAQKILTLGRSYQAAAVLAAAADLNLFERLGRGRRTAAELSKQLQCDLRGLSVLLDALVALKLVEKSANSYCLRPGLRPMLTAAFIASHVSPRVILNTQIPLVTTSLAKLDE